MTELTLTESSGVSVEPLSATCSEISTQPTECTGETHTTDVEVNDSTSHGDPPIKTVGSETKFVPAIVTWGKE